MALPRLKKQEGKEVDYCNITVFSPNGNDEFAEFIKIIGRHKGIRTTNTVAQSDSSNQITANPPQEKIDIKPDRVFQS